MRRCAWCQASPAYRDYHDREWGFPVDDETRLFEKLCLEGFQAGLSWLTILNKREAFRRAFAGFDAARVARFGERDVDAPARRRRHRPPSRQDRVDDQQRPPRARAARRVRLARRLRLALRAGGGARPKRVTPAALQTRGLPPEALALAKDLKRRGWSFVGPTTVYAFMQAMGLVNDHLEGCVVRAAAEAARAARARRRGRVHDAEARRRAPPPPRSPR